MGWYFKRIKVQDGTTRSDPLKETVNFVNGNLCCIAVMMPATSTAWGVGLRIKTPSMALLPAIAEGTDSWLRSQVKAYEVKFDDYQYLGDVSPVNIIMEATNTSGSEKRIQVGFHIETINDKELQTLNNIYMALNAMQQASGMPDFEKSIRRAAEIIVNSLKAADAE